MEKEEVPIINLEEGRSTPMPPRAKLSAMLRAIPPEIGTVALDTDDKYSFYWFKRGERVLETHVLGTPMLSIPAFRGSESITLVVPDDEYEVYSKGASLIIGKMCERNITRVSSHRMRGVFFLLAVFCFVLLLAGNIVWPIVYLAAESTPAGDRVHPQMNLQEAK